MSSASPACFTSGSTRLMNEVDRALPGPSERLCKTRWDAASPIRHAQVSESQPCSGPLGDPLHFSSCAGSLLSSAPSLPSLGHTGQHFHLLFFILPSVPFSKTPALSSQAGKQRGGPLLGTGDPQTTPSVEQKSPPSPDSSHSPQTCLVPSLPTSFLTAGGGKGFPL